MTPVTKPSRTAQQIASEILNFPVTQTDEERLRPRTFHQPLNIAFKEYVNQKLERSAKQSYEDLDHAEIRWEQKTGSFKRLLERLERLKAGEALSVADKVVIQSTPILLNILASCTIVLPTAGRNDGIVPPPAMIQTVRHHLTTNLPRLFEELATALDVDIDRRTVLRPL